jgi:hypothetical protein
MSKESNPESAENQQGLEESGSEPKSEESEASIEVRSRAARIKRYGLTPQQAKEMDLYL